MYPYSNNATQLDEALNELESNGEAFVLPTETPEPPAEPEDVVPAVPDELLPDFTEMGNSDRLIERFGSELRYCREDDKTPWRYWNGRFWDKDKGELHVTRLMKQLLLEMKVTAQNALDELPQDLIQSMKSKLTPDGKVKADQKLTDDENKIVFPYTRFTKQLKCAIDHQTYSKISGAIRLAESKSEIAIAKSEFDKNPLVLNLANGTLYLDTMTFVETHERSEYCSRISPVRYDRRATCPEFEEWLNTIMLGNQENKNYLQKYFGVTLTGLQLAIILILVGNGRNGKSVLTELITQVLGMGDNGEPGYAANIAFNTFTVRRESAGGTREDLIRLQGYRYVIASEANPGSVFDIAALKEATGGEHTTARGLYKSEEQFRPIFKLTFKTNNPPSVNDNTDAAWERIKQLEFKYKVPKEIRDEEFAKKLFAKESSGILNWMLRGLTEFLGLKAEGRAPLADTPDIAASTEAYRVSEVQVAQFVEDRCELQFDAFTSSAELYRAYLDWCQSVKERADAKRTFITALEKEYAQHVSRARPGKNHVRGLQGIRLKTQAESSADASPEAEGAQEMAF